MPEVRRKDELQPSAQPIQRRERGLARIGSELAIYHWLSMILIIAAATLGPKAAAFLRGESPLTLSTEEPNADNIGIIMSEILQDDIGTLGIMFPLVEDAIFADIYPFDTSVSPEITAFADLPALSPSTASLHGFAESGTQILTISFSRTFSTDADGHAQVLLQVKTPGERAVRHTFILNEVGQREYQEYLDSLSLQSLSWDESQIQRYSLNVNSTVTFENLPENLPDETVFFSELRRMIGVHERHQLMALSWRRSYQVTANGEYREIRYLQVILPSEHSSDPDYRSFSVRLENGQLVVTNENFNWSFPRDPQNYPFIAQLFQH